MGADRKPPLAASGSIQLGQEVEDEAACGDDDLIGCREQRAQHHHRRDVEEQCGGRADPGSSVAVTPLSDTWAVQSVPSQ